MTVRCSARIWPSEPLQAVGWARDWAIRFPKPALPLKFLWLGIPKRMSRPYSVDGAPGRPRPGWCKENKHPLLRFRCQAPRNCPESHGVQRSPRRPWRQPPKKTRPRLARRPMPGTSTRLQYGGLATLPRFGIRGWTHSSSPSMRDRDAHARPRELGLTPTSYVLKGWKPIPPRFSSCRQRIGPRPPKIAPRSPPGRAACSSPFPRGCRGLVRWANDLGPIACESE